MRAGGRPAGEKWEPVIAQWKKRQSGSWSLTNERRCIVRVGYRLREEAE